MADHPSAPPHLNAVLRSLIQNQIEDRQARPTGGHPRMDLLVRQLRTEHQA